MSISIGNINILIDSLRSYGRTLENSEDPDNSFSPYFDTMDNKGRLSRERLSPSVYGGGKNHSVFKQSGHSFFNPNLDDSWNSGIYLEFLASIKYK